MTMSSKWNQAKSKRQTPPWCKVGLFPVVPLIIDGVPQFLLAYLAWKDTDPTPWNPDITAAMKLPWDAGASAWMAHDPGPGLSLGGKVTGSPEADFTFELTIYDEGRAREDTEWTDVEMGPDFPWSSDLMEHIFISGEDRFAMQIVA